MGKGAPPRSRQIPDAGTRGATRAADGQALSGTNVERAGDHNQRVTLQVIRVSGSATRAEIAARTGLTPTTVANITNRLIEDGLVVEAGRIRGSRGQPAITLAIDPDARFSFGINVDRDHITVVLLDFLGKVRARKSVEVLFALPEAVHAFVSEAAIELIGRAGIDGSRVVGCGVAFPTDLTRTRLPEQPEEYAAWASTSIAALVASALNVPVRVENDAAAAAIGEMHFGDGQRYRSFFYLLVTAGLGGGVVMDGSYYRGSSERSGEIGWLRTVLPDGRREQLQTIVSLSALYARLARAGLRPGSPQELVALPADGALVVQRWIEEATRVLVDALCSVNCLFNPDAILIGGRLPAPIVERLAQSLDERMASLAAELPAVAPVARAALADDAPAVGAAILAFSDDYLPARHALLKAGLDELMGEIP